MTSPIAPDEAQDVDLVVRIEGSAPGEVFVGEGERRPISAPLSFPRGFDPVERSRAMRLAMVHRMRSARGAPVTREVLGSDDKPPLPVDEAELGTTLFKALFGDPRLFSLLDRWRAGGGRGRIRLQPSAAWAPVAWEMLCETQEGGGVFLGVQGATPLVREVAASVAFPGSVKVAAKGLRVLGVAASPADLPPLNVEEERRLLDAALKDTAALTWVDPDEESVRNALRSPAANYHVFHFAGHGSFDGQTGYLYFGRDRQEKVSADDLATALLRCRTLRLVVLNACEGAAAGAEANAVSIAERLVVRGIPAVLAMQSPIRDTTGLEIVRDFHENIASGTPVERAVNDLRFHLRRKGLEWAAPVLTMGSPRTPLFLPAQAGDSRFPWGKVLGGGASAVALAGALVLAIKPPPNIVVPADPDSPDVPADVPVPAAPRYQTIDKPPCARFGVALVPLSGDVAGAAIDEARLDCSPAKGERLFAVCAPPCEGGSAPHCVSVAAGGATVGEVTARGSVHAADTLYTCLPKESLHWTARLRVRVSPADKAISANGWNMAAPVGIPGVSFVSGRRIDVVDAASEGLLGTVGLPVHMTSAEASEPTDSKLIPVVGGPASAVIESIAPVPAPGAAAAPDTLFERAASNGWGAPHTGAWVVWESAAAPSRAGQKLAVSVKLRGDGEARKCTLSSAGKLDCPAQGNATPKCESPAGSGFDCSKCTGCAAIHGTTRIRCEVCGGRIQ